MDVEASVEVPVCWVEIRLGGWERAAVFSHLEVVQNAPAARCQIESRDGLISAADYRTQSLRRRIIRVFEAHKLVSPHLLCQELGLSETEARALLVSLLREHILIEVNKRLPMYKLSIADPYQHLTMLPMPGGRKAA